MFQMRSAQNMRGRATVRRGCGGAVRALMIALVGIAFFQSAAPAVAASGGGTPSPDPAPQATPHAPSPEPITTTSARSTAVLPPSTHHSIGSAPTQSPVNQLPVTHPASSTASTSARTATRVAASSKHTEPAGRHPTRHRITRHSSATTTHRAVSHVTTTAPGRSPARRTPAVHATRDHAIQGGGLVLLAGAIGLLVLAAAGGVLLREMVAMRAQWPGEAQG